MKFLVNVRWFPTNGEGATTGSWIVNDVRKEGSFLVLEEVRGIMVLIPLTCIERLDMERKG